jgi:hypothetical protein
MLERPQRRAHSGEADDRIQDYVRLRPFEQFGRIAAHLRQRREAVDRSRARRRRDELELRALRDHLERLAADRSGGAEEGDAFHCRKCACLDGLGLDFPVSYKLIRCRGIDT